MEEKVEVVGDDELSKKETFRAEYTALKHMLEAYEYVNAKDFQEQRDKIIHAVDSNKDGFIVPEEFQSMAERLELVETIEEATRYLTLINKKFGKEGFVVSIADFVDWWKAPFDQEFQGGDEAQVEFVRMKLRAEDLPLEEVKQVRKVKEPCKHDSPAMRHWSKVRSLLGAIKFYRAIWHEAPGSPSLVGAAERKAKERGGRLLHLTIIRHGQSEANLASDLHKGENVYMFDPDLTPFGVQQAQERQKDLEKDHPVELVVVSPLRRTLRTCLHVFSHLVGKVPFVVHPLCREQVTDADDVGNFKETLEKEFPQFDYTLMPHGSAFWWYIPEDKKIEGETDLEAFKQRYKDCGGWEEPVPIMAERVKEFEAWLISRHESHIGIVSHGDFIECMTGANLRNAQKLLLEIDPLHLPEPKYDL